jgi:hypothetical protein
MLSKKGSFFEVGKNTINVFNTKVDVLYILWFLFIIFLVMSYSFLYCQFKFFDFMTHKYTKHISGWLISHFIAFAVAGFFFPNTLVLSMILGILWEIVEWSGGKFKPSFLKPFGECHSKGPNKVWWYGKYEDIIADFAGFMAGKYVLIGLFK